MRLSDHDGDRCCASHDLVLRAEACRTHAAARQANGKSPSGTPAAAIFARPVEVRERRVAYESVQDNITSHLAMFETYRTTIYADVERVATTGIGNRARMAFCRLTFSKRPT
jgi:hypothetical protein